MLPDRYGLYVRDDAVNAGDFDHQLYQYSLNQALDLQGKIAEQDSILTGKMAALVQGAARPLAVMANAASSLANLALSPTQWEAMKFDVENWEASKKHPVWALVGEGIGMTAAGGIVGKMITSLPRIGQIYSGMSRMARAATANGLVYGLGLDPDSQDSTMLKAGLDSITQGGYSEFERDAIGDSELAKRLSNALAGATESGMIEGILEGARMLKASRQIKNVGSKILRIEPVQPDTASRILERRIVSRTKSLRKELPTDLSPEEVETVAGAMIRAEESGAGPEEIRGVMNRMVRDMVKSKDSRLTMDKLDKYVQTDIAKRNVEEAMIYDTNIQPQDLYATRVASKTYTHEAFLTKVQIEDAIEKGLPEGAIKELRDQYDKYMRYAIRLDMSLVQQNSASGRNLAFERWSREKGIPTWNSLPLTQQIEYITSLPTNYEDFARSANANALVTTLSSKNVLASAYVTNLIGTPRSVLRNFLGGMNRSLEEAFSDTMLSTYRWGKGEGNFADVLDNLAATRNAFHKTMGGILWGRNSDLPVGPTMLAGEGIQPNDVSAYLALHEKGGFWWPFFKTLQAHQAMASRVAGLNTKGDLIVRGFNYQRSLEVAARRTARAEGLAGKQFYDRIERLITNPTAAMMDEAEDLATRAVFQERPPQFIRGLMSAQQNSMIIRFLVPFIKTPYNIIRYELETTPLIGLMMKNVREDLAAGGARAARVWTRWTMTGAQMGMAGALADADRLTGAGPLDPSIRRIWLQTHKPYSIKIGGNWVSYAGLEPIAQRLGVMADFVEIMREAQPDQFDEIMGAAYLTLMRDVTRKSMLYNMGQIYEMTSNTSSVGQVAGTLISSIVAPPTISPATTLIDPYYRETNTMLDRIKSRIPGLSRTLQPKIDVFGNPILRDESWYRALGNAFQPLAVHPVEGDRVVDELMRLHMYPGWASEAIGGPEEPLLVTRQNTQYGIQLNPEEFKKYQEYTGKLPVLGMNLHERLENLMDHPSYGVLSDEEKARQARQIFGQHRANAREFLINSGDITQRLQQIVDVNVGR